MTTTEPIPKQPIGSSTNAQQGDKQVWKMPEMPGVMKKQDKVTILIWKLLQYSRMPFLANMYSTSPMLYNFLLIGISGAVINFIIYDMALKPIMEATIPYLGGALAYVTATLCVLFWDFIWVKKWAITAKAQIQKMTIGEKISTIKVLKESMTESEIAVAYDIFNKQPAGC